MSELFWIDDLTKKTYADLIHDLNHFKSASGIIFEKEPYWVFLKMLHSAVNEYPVTLLDGGFTKEELVINGVFDNEQEKAVHGKWRQFDSWADIKKQILNSSKTWQMTLLTSGTTGVPKKITHSIQSLTKAVKIFDTKKADIWGFAYNPAHMAGLQVFWQAFLNQNPMINVFRKSADQVKEEIQKYKITHISATPTFYRLIWDKNEQFPSVRHISSGGERFPSDLKVKLLQMFPNARIRNIYASTEAGSLFAADGEYFHIPERLQTRVRIEGDELLIHKEIIGSSDDFQCTGDWYHTGDIVEAEMRDSGVFFKFLHRKNEMINVGGSKVNPLEIEQELCRINGIKNAKVYGKDNSVTGKILCADVSGKNINEKEIRKILSDRLNPVNIPRIIQFVDKIEQTRTGKLQR